MNKIIDIELPDFENFLKNDMSSNDFARFPIRVILVNDLDSWSRVIEILKRNCDEIVYCSEYSIDDDTFPNITQILVDAKMHVLEGKKVLLYPFGEILRLDNPKEKKYLSRLNEIIQIESDPKKNARLYLPLFDLDEIFYPLWDSILDINKRKYPAIRVSNKNIDNYDKIEVFITRNKKFLQLIGKIEKITPLKGVKKYLEAWEYQSFTNQILLCSELLYEYQLSRIGVVSLKCIGDYRQFLNEVLKFRVPVYYNEDEEEYWHKLAKEMIANNINEFVQFAKFELNANHFSRDLFNNWEKYDSFKKWIVYHWAKFEVRDNSYLSFILSNSEFSSFENKLWNGIFDIENPTLENVKERNSILRSTKVKQPENFISKVNEIKDPLKKLMVLTSITDFEKQVAIKTFGECIKERKNDELLKKLLAVIFPELSYYYYGYPILNNEFLQNYMKNYIKAKILNTYTNELAQLSESLNNFNLFEFQSRNSVIEKLDGKILIIDGLSIEWLGLIENLLNELGYRYESRVVRVNFPTRTEFNRINNARIIDDLDKLFHQPNPEYPKLIYKEIETISKIIKSLPQVMGESDKIIITGDHGATYFSGWCIERINVDEEIKVESLGRYAISVSKDIKEKSEYIVEEIEGKRYIISKTHKVFKGGKKMNGEIHGGATPEEALVPVIVVWKSGESLTDSKINVEILNKNREILVIRPILLLEFNMKVKEVSVVIENITVKGKSNDKIKWEVDLSSLKLKPGEYDILISYTTLDNSLRSKRERIRIKPGIEEEELFGGGL